MIQNSFFSEDWGQEIDVYYEIVDITFEGEICKFRLKFNDNTNDNNLFVLDSGGYFHGKGRIAVTQKNINSLFRDEIQDFLDHEYIIPESDKLELILQRTEDY